MIFKAILIIAGILIGLALAVCGAWWYVTTLFKGVGKK